MNKTTLYIIIAFAIVCLIAVGATIGVVKHATSIDKEKLQEDVLSVTDENTQNETENAEEIVEEDYKGPEIYQGDAREVAVMIDNETAVTSHAGLNSAYMLYEFIIEGGESRIMAFFKGTMPDKIGPVRSSRHYFLDYALEHDAIYVHFGWSPKAQSDIKTLGINNINGIYDDFYWREAPKSSYHNAFTSMENILRFATKYKKYRTTTDKGPIIEYNKKDTDLESENVANKVYIKYSNLQSTTYTYDETEKIYLRSKRDYEHKDRFTGERFYAKNIIAVYVEDQLLPDTEDKGRRELYNIGTGDGYFITNGKSIPITWTKTSRSSRTIYKDLNGNEIKLNDGITWVQIVPITGKIEIN